MFILLCLNVQDYLVRLDQGTSLGLSGSSIGCLSIGDITYSPGIDHALRFLTRSKNFVFFYFIECDS